MGGKSKVVCKTMEEVVRRRERVLNALQQLLDAREREITIAKATIRMIVTGGFEGSYSLNIVEGRIIVKRGRCCLYISATNGELELEITKV